MSSLMRLNALTYQRKLGLAMKDVQMEGKLCELVPVVLNLNAHVPVDGEEHAVLEVCKIPNAINFSLFKAF